MTYQYALNLYNVYWHSTLYGDSLNCPGGVGGMGGGGGDKLAIQGIL